MNYIVLRKKMDIMGTIRGGCLAASNCSVINLLHLKYTKLLCVWSMDVHMSKRDALFFCYLT